MLPLEIKYHLEKGRGTNKKVGLEQSIKFVSPISGLIPERKNGVKPFSGGIFWHPSVRIYNSYFPCKCFYLQRLEHLPELHKYFLSSNRISSFETFTIESFINPDFQIFLIARFLMYPLLLSCEHIFSFTCLIYLCIQIYLSKSL